MDISGVKHGLDILIYSSKGILSRLDRFNYVVKEIFEIKDFYGSREKKFEQITKSLLDFCDEILNFLKKEIQVEKLLKRLDKRICLEVREDIITLLKYFEKIREMINEIRRDVNNFESYKKYKALQKHEARLKRLQNIENKFIEITKNGIYKEWLLRETLVDTEKLWETNIKNKVVWLYHGTSILFLPLIQKYGLNSSKLPRGILKAISNLKELGFGGGDPLKLVQSKISFWWHEDVRESAFAPDLPALLYEQLDPNRIKSDPLFKEKYNKLDLDEKKMINAIIRFGHSLIRRNKVVVLRIPVDSDFLRYLGIPNYLLDFSIFFENFIKKSYWFKLLKERRKDLIFFCSDPRVAFNFFNGEESDY